MLILVLPFIFTCEREEPVYVEENVEVPDQEMWNSSVKVSHKGRTEAIVKYGHMERYSKRSVSYFDDGLVIDFFNSDGEHASKLTANRGEMKEKSNDVKAMGNVVVISDSGVTLHTEELYYDEKRDLIISNVEVMITTADGDTLYGKGFESNAEFTETTILEPHGIAHSGVDLSADNIKSKKKVKQNSTGQMAADSLAKADSTDKTIQADEPKK